MAERAIVLANGDIGDASILMARLAAWDDAVVIAADGGGRHAAPLKLSLTAIIGDMDSINRAALSAFEAAGVRVIAASEHKDETDLELALLHAVSTGAARIAVLGALGGRLDMTLANLQLLLHPRLSAAHIEMWNGAQTAWLITPPGRPVSGRSGDTLSLLPLGGEARGITTQGLAYPLQNETLSAGPARGVSNVLTGPEARVDLQTGALLAVHTPGRA